MGPLLKLALDDFGYGHGTQLRPQSRHVGLQRLPNTIRFRTFPLVGTRRWYSSVDKLSILKADMTRCRSPCGESSKTWIPDAPRSIDVFIKLLRILVRLCTDKTKGLESQDVVCGLPSHDSAATAVWCAHNPRSLFSSREWLDTCPEA